MILPRFRLTLALAASLLLHLAPFVADQLPGAAPARNRPAIQARLAPAPAPAMTMPSPLPTQPTLRQTQAAPLAQPARKIADTQNSTKTPHSPKTWQQEVQQQFRKRQAQGLFYPAEAIENAWQGEVIVFLILDPDGQVSAARVEQGSGFRVLDEAALHAVRALRALPADAPRETLLPVRFRLK